MLVVVMAGTLPWIVAMNAPREEQNPKAFMIKQAIRSCEAGQVDLILSSLEMHGTEDEIIAIGEAFADACEVSAQTAGFVLRARRRLAAP